MEGDSFLNNSSSSNKQKGDQRKTTRTNAGVPPQRLGVPNAVSVAQSTSSSTMRTSPRIPGGSRRRGSPTQSISGRSTRSFTSTQTSRSYSSTVQKSQIDVATEEEIDELEEQYETNERAVRALELEVKCLLDTIKAMTDDLTLLPVEDEQGIKQLQEQILKNQKLLTEKSNDVDKKRLALKFNEKTLIRKKTQLRRKAELQKQIVDEDERDNDDNLSQKLSDSEGEVDEEASDLVRQRTVLEQNLVHHRRLAEAALQEARDAAATNPTAAAVPEAVPVSASATNPSEHDDLLLRLRRLQEPVVNPIIPITVSQLIPNRSIINPPTFHQPANGGEDQTNQFAQVLARAFENLAINSRSTDKFLARQVQGKDLPFFSGRPEEWSTFITAYENTTQNCSYNNQDNLPRLQKCLKGEAIKTVQCLLNRAENVPAIIAKLKMRFGRPEHIVRMLITKAKEVPPFKEDRLDLLIDFGFAVDNLVATIRALNSTEHLTSPQLLEEFARKLPVSYRTKWMEWVISDPTRRENLETFAEWMSKQTELACKICPPVWKEESTPKKFEQGKPRRKEERVWAVEETTFDRRPRPNQQGRESKCLFCDQREHRVLQCPKFKDVETEEKWKWVKSNRHCFCCLRYGHSVRECRSKKECGKDGCQKTHHPLLHKQQLQAPAPTPSANTVATINHAFQSNIKSGTYINMMVLPVKLKGPRGIMTTLAFLDSGSSVTVIDDGIANRLGLEGPETPFSHQGLHSLKTEEGSRSVSVTIQNINGDRSFLLQKVRTVPNLALPRQAVKAKMLKKWKHLQNVNIQPYELDQATILIGQDNLHLCNTSELILGPPNAPGAGKTALEWVLVGRVDESCRTEFSYMTQQQTDDLHQLVKEHFTTEDFGVKVTQVNQRSKENVRAQQIMDSTIQRTAESWEIGLLWKSDDEKLPNTKEVAMTRLLQMERKMDRDPDFAKQYVAKIEEYQQKGFARILSTEEAEIEGPRTFYLPHFMSKNPKKPKKLRFVFDAAAKVRGVCLNDTLLKGPDKLTSLPSVLFKFRQRAIGITGDIKDKFHRVKVRKEDASAQRFLWRGLDRNRNPDVMEMGVLIFGAACSPACAQEVKNLNALRFKDQYPESADAIVTKHYVDDYLDSLDAVPEAIQRFHEVRSIHLSGGFDICNWLSNDVDLLSAIPVELHSPGVKSMDFQGGAERVLGLFWKPNTDQFTFSKTFLKANEELMSNSRLPTKRELLSLVMSIFDPLGFLSLFTVKARIILQETWRTAIGWDDEIPGSLQDKWERWNEELKKIEEFKLPRCYSPSFSTADEVQLHVFCDASEQAFGAVTYLRIKKGDNLTISFVSAKAKVAPTKHLTIPRLELQAAVLGSRLATFIKNEHDVKIHKTVYWSDSRTVLCWIRADGKTFQQFVSSRIGEIQECSEVAEWRWVPTKQNVADEMTRDSQPSDWSTSSRWMNGPEFLKMPEEDWPQEAVTSPIPADELEIKKDFLCAILQKPPIIDINRFSTWSRAVRTVGYVMRFIKNCRLPKRGRPVVRELLPKEITGAECWWWKFSQSESFAEDLDCWKNGKPLGRSSRLVNLNASLDDQAVIRLFGRINNADVTEQVKNPVVLDPKHRFTQLLISHHHVKGGHHGQEKTVNELRQTFHILNVRAAVKRSWNECQKCKNDRAQPVVPIMGQLPASRLQSYVSPFTSTGIDYFGPMTVTIGRRNEKRWGVLFTCLSTRAVHMELAASLSTDSCLMAIRRFVARRGCPLNIYSDNGTNFVGANNELKVSIQEINQEMITEGCSSHGITWHFIPPTAPHMGGSWERLVKSVKVALHAALKETNPREEVLHTLVIEAEHIVNSHPLTHVPVDPEDPEALTPNHFLIGRSSNVQAPGMFSDGDLCSRKQWRKAQQLANNFWKRWVREYLPTLLRRGKWFHQTEPIKMGDIVLVVDNQLTRNSWPMGRVVELYPGKDGLIRVVDVKTATGVYRRPVAKLCKLDVTQSGSGESGSSEESDNAPVPATTTDDSEDLGVNAAA